MCSPNTTIPFEEVKKHRMASNAWIVIHNEVYDVTKFINNHPGGREPLLGMAGKDATLAFEDVGHSETARNLLKNFKIGALRQEDRVIYIDPCCRAVPSKNSSGRSKTPGTQERFTRSVDVIRIPSKNKWLLYLLLLAGVAAGGLFAAKKFGG